MTAEEHELDEAPAPRLCHLIKWPDFDGYGFNLHAERSNPGQFIGKIDDESPAQLAGLREGDRIIEVNGVNINNENHRQVVERIKANPDEARLLVVDPAADLWYREHDLVVKSSQMNVVYRRTPVPRPAPDSPRANHHNTTTTANNTSQQQQQSTTTATTTTTTTTTSDNNNKQEEKQQEQKQQDTEQTTDNAHDSLEQPEPDSIEAPVEPGAPAAPPMSPDSGAGAEDEQLTVEAEINLQTANVSEADKSRKQRLVDEVKQLQASKQTAMGQTIEPDSLTSESIATTTIDNIDAKEQARQVHNRSADSGKSSSADATTRSSSSSSSSSDRGSHSSLVAEDSLEEAQPQPANLTTKLSHASASREVNKQTQPVELAAHVIEPSAAQMKKVEGVESSVGQAPIGEGETRKNVDNNNLDEQQNKNSGKGDDDDDDDDDDIRAQTNLPTLNKFTTDASQRQELAEVEMISGPNRNNNNNNNYSGLNLNMTASQMRELIASRKKFDPKKAAMNLRQKYEIIQQM